VLLQGTEDEKPVLDGLYCRQTLVRTCALQQVRWQEHYMKCRQAWFRDPTPQQAQPIGPELAANDAGNKRMLKPATTT
jgi:hypothetical protein